MPHRLADNNRYKYIYIYSETKKIDETIKKEENKLVRAFYICVGFSQQEELQQSPFMLMSASASVPHKIITILV